MWRYVKNRSAYACSDNDRWHKACRGLILELIVRYTYGFESNPVIIKTSKELELRRSVRMYLDDNGQFQMLPEYPEFAWFEGVVNAGLTATILFMEIIFVL